MRAFHGLWRIAACVALSILIVSPDLLSGRQEPSLAVSDAGVQRAEDGAYASADYEFLPGDYLYFSLHIAGYATSTDEKTQAKAIDLKYEITPQDANGVALVEPVKGSIQQDLGREDKNWVPKRRSSFLLPSYVAAGSFVVHVVVQDLIAKTEARRDYPFTIGGLHVTAANSIQVTAFQFLRNQDDPGALDVAAYSPGDTIWAHFQMIGFKHAAENQYRLAYGIKVMRPDGKVFLDDPKAAEISASNFYPAPYVPGELQISTPKNAARGSYQLTLTVVDMVANQSVVLKRSFTVE